ncbi:MAG: CDP-diacylglycerol diphosphatase, partial [Methylobacterium sp.]
MRWIVPTAIVLAALPAAARAAGDPSRDVLWAALKTCVLAKRLADRTFPCLDVDLGDKDRPGTAVLRAPGEPTHVVVMPTDTVAGLEAPVLRGARGIA